MSLINYSTKEICCKIVYYGPGRGGKTTNLLYIYNRLPENSRAEMISIDTKGDRTLFFDFLPLDLGKVAGLKIRVQLYTVPGQVQYNATRKLVLKGVDGVVFVADSLKAQREANIESLINLEENLKDEGKDIRKIPLVMQFNKRDLEKSLLPIMPIEEMEKDLNQELMVPVFPASAINGIGVLETLKAISQLVVNDTANKLLGKARYKNG